MKWNALILRKFSLDADLLLKKLERISADFRKDSREIMNKASEPLLDDIKSRAPVSKRPHNRYVKSGELVATYYPGNLNRSFRDLKLKRKKDGIVVGAKIKKGFEAASTFNSKTKVDGYYAHMVEFGTINSAPHPFVRPAVQATGFQVLSIAESLIRMRIEMYQRGIKPSGL